MRSADLVRHISEHFRENWMERVGNWPTLEAVRAYVEQSVMVQPGRMLRDLTGRPYRQLAIYWHPDLNLIMTFDRQNGVAVSVLTAEVLRVPAQEYGNGEK